ncbi:MAG: OmpA family protein [Acidobacteriaceae bacterium]|nr:OmpA family protein [Acidobacteriaceae bacterium]MBV8571477.1 OmpA family protein [Acidobacteriaceae bacterium]
MPATTQPVIIIKKKQQHHAGHHGGAWKVAYADFVTALMALFIVLWLMTTSDQLQKSIAGYFRDPKGFGTQTGSSLGGTGESLTITKSNMQLLKAELQENLRKSPEFAKLKDHVLMTVTGEGLRIELLETEKGVFFESGESKPTPLGENLLRQLSAQLGQLKNPIVIEGHTDSKPFDSPSYSNWELSADRANCARRIMQLNGLHPGQVTEVRGFADQRLRLSAHPADASNRRISIVVEYPHEEVPEAAAKPVPVKSATHENQTAKPALIKK